MFINITPDDLARIIEVMKQSQTNKSDAMLIRQLEGFLENWKPLAFDLDEIPF